MARFSKAFQVQEGGVYPFEEIKRFLESGLVSGPIEIRVVGEIAGLERVRQRQEKKPRKRKAELFEAPTP